jgi:glucose-6-phosphate 1-dehydrogenase
VPFYLRTGKRMEAKLAEIVITFREAPHSLFDGGFFGPRPNRLVIRLQPSEELQLHLWAKAPGDDMTLRRVALDLDFEDAYRKRSLDAYERLLCDIFRGQLTLFMRRDELMAAWRWIDPILNAWNSIDDAPRRYNAGTWGPAAASALLSRDGAAWSEEL